MVKVLDPYQPENDQSGESFNRLARFQERQLEFQEEQLAFQREQAGKFKDPAEEKKHQKEKEAESQKAEFEKLLKEKKASEKAEEIGKGSEGWGKILRLIPLTPHNTAYMNYLAKARMQDFKTLKTAGDVSRSGAAFLTGFDAKGEEVTMWDALGEMEKNIDTYIQFLFESEKIRKEMEEKGTETEKFISGLKDRVSGMKEQLEKMRNELISKTEQREAEIESLIPERDQRDPNIWLEAAKNTDQSTEEGQKTFKEHMRKAGLLMQQNIDLGMIDHSEEYEKALNRDSSLFFELRSSAPMDKKEMGNLAQKAENRRKNYNDPLNDFKSEQFVAGQIQEGKGEYLDSPRVEQALQDKKLRKILATRMVAQQRD